MELGSNTDNIPIQKKQIAATRDIPGPFLDHILSDLRRSGFINSFRGPKGGHLLAKSPNQINLLPFEIDASFFQYRESSIYSYL